MFPNLRAEQARHGLTNKDMGERLGISRTTYEAKKKNGHFSVSESRTLCQLFGCSFDYLFDTNGVSGPRH